MSAVPKGKLPLPELAAMKQRGDWETVEAHLAAIRERRPQLEPLYRALADATAALAVR